MVEENKKETLREVEEDWDMKALNHPSSVYSAEQKMIVVTTFVLTGKTKAAAGAAGVPWDIVRAWKTKSVWWSDAVHKVRKEKQDELDSVMTNTIHDSLDAIRDRIELGDTIRDAKTGELVRIPMKGKELAVTAAVLFDKRSLIRGDATSISSRRADPLKDIEDKLKEFAKISKVKSVK